jgi:hypothetical protein
MPSPAVPLTIPSGPPEPDAPYVLSYFAQRRAAGYIGIALPPIVLLFDHCVFSHHCVPASISASYYTGVRNFFVGSLCAVGVFLVCSIGFKRDAPWSILAGSLALLVAFCPTDPDTACSRTNAHSPFSASHAIHSIAAISLFLTFAVFCLYLFTRSSQFPGVAQPNLQALPPQKRKRNVVFITCGWIMLVAMLLHAGWWVLSRFAHFPMPDHLLFATEWICLWAFGFAWLVKGQQILAD